MENKELLTPREVASILRLEVHTIYSYIKSGRLPAISIGGRYRVLREDLLRFIEQRRIKRGNRGDLNETQAQLSGDNS